MSGRPLRRVVIKEELVALTGDATRAILLNQFLYWQARVRDYDRFLLEELKRRSLAESGASDELPLSNGWIYKSAEELGEEVMLGLSKQSILRRLDELVAAGWLHRRRNPKHAWDRTLQYRCNLQRIHADLLAIGYHLDGWVLDLLEPEQSGAPDTPPPAENRKTDPSSILEHREANMERRPSILESREAAAEHQRTNVESRESNLAVQYQREHQRSPSEVEAEKLPPPPSGTEDLEGQSVVARRLLASKWALGPLLDTLMHEDPSRSAWLRLPTARIEAILREGRRIAKARGLSPVTAVKELLDAAASAELDVPQLPSERSGARAAMAEAEAEADARVDPRAMARLLSRLAPEAQRSALANLPTPMRERVLQHLRGDIEAAEPLDRRDL
jgi:hypothetical protein